MKNSKEIFKKLEELRKHFNDVVGGISTSPYGSVCFWMDNPKKFFKKEVKKVFSPQRFHYDSYRLREADLTEVILGKYTIHINIYFQRTLNVTTITLEFSYGDYEFSESFNTIYEIEGFPRVPDKTFYEVFDIEDDIVCAGVAKGLQEIYEIYQKLFLGEVVNPFLKMIGEEEIV